MADEQTYIHIETTSQADRQTDRHAVSTRNAGSNVLANVQYVAICYSIVVFDWCMYNGKC